MEIVLLTIVGTLGAAYLAFLLKQAWSKADVRTRFRREVIAAKASERSTEAEQLAVLREQVLEVAAELGKVLPVSVQGSQPQVVTFSDGGVSYFCGDMGAYMRMMNSGRVDPRRSFPARFSQRPVSQWSRVELEDWLNEHAGD